MKNQEHMEIPPSCGARTDVGRMRPQNEDSLIVSAPLFAVADGMGGHEAGEVASEIAIETLVAQAPNTADARALGRAVMAANRAVIDAAENGVGKPGMGTTMTAAILQKKTLVIAQVGDSRAYLLHGGRLSQITRDHSLVEDLIEAGEITAEEARWHPQRSVITRALGSDPEMVPDLFDMQLDEGDRILLCSDGLSGMVYDEELQQILSSHDDPQECADALIDAANTNGGHDNITAIVLDVTGEETIMAEKKQRRRVRTRIITFIIVFVAIVAICGGALYYYAQSSAYLIDENGYVAVYRGIPGHVGPFHLSWHETTTNVAVSKLPEATAESLGDGVTVNSLDEAYSLISDYQDEISASTSSTSKTTSSSSTSSGTGSTSSSTGSKSTSTTSSTSSGGTSSGSTTTSGTSSGTQGQ